MTLPKRILMMVDQDVGFDKRVHFFRDSYIRLGYQVDILDVRDFSGRVSFVSMIFSLLEVVYSLVKNPDRTISCFARFLRFCNRESVALFRSMPFFRYLKISFRETLVNYALGSRLRKKSFDYDFFHVNDFRCLVFFLGYSFGKKIPFLYDSHELHLFRNRGKWSVSRVLLNAVFEELGVSASTAVMTVSPAAQDLLSFLYPERKCFYIENRFYEAVDCFALNGFFRSDDRVAIVYVGVVNTGRGLDLLSMISRKCHDEIIVYVFAFGDAESARQKLESFDFDFNSDSVKIIFPTVSDINNDLMRIKGAHKTVYSWCFIEPICLSYKYAQPNKYFQYIEYGFPVIVSCNTFLSEEVEDKCLGIVCSKGDFVGDDFSDFFALAVDRYDDYKGNIGRYSQALRSEDLSDTVRDFISEFNGIRY